MISLQVYAQSGLWQSNAERPSAQEMKAKFLKVSRRRPLPHWHYKAAAHLKARLSWQVWFWCGKAVKM